MKKTSLRVLLSTITIVGILLFLIIVAWNKKIENSDIQIFINDKKLDTNSGNTGDNTIISATSLHTEFENIFENRTKDKGIKVFINNKEIKGKTPIKIERLAKDIFLEITIKNSFSQKKYRLQTLPETFAKPEIYGRSPYTGDYYTDNISANADSYIYKMNNAGDILFYYKKYANNVSSLMNFQKFNIENNIYYTFFESVENIHQSKLGLGVVCGEIVVLDNKYQETNKISLLPTKLISNEGCIENHEFILLGKNHYIVSAVIIKNTYIDSIKDSADIIENYIQEVKDGKVVFEWISTNEPGFLENSVEGNNFKETKDLAADYIHINSIAIDPKDSNVLVSFRNQDAIVKIDKKTNKIMRTLGGKGDQFGLTEDQSFSKQHFAKYTADGSILLYDNGNNKKQSRVIKINLDEKNKKILRFNSFQRRGTFAMFAGSVQELEENKNIYLINWGGGNMKGNLIASEINFDTHKTLAEIISKTNIPTYRTIKK